MRIDPVQVAARSNQAESAFARRSSMPQPPKQEKSVKEETKAAVPAAPAQAQISVSIDKDKNVIYQFLDPRTGEVLQQVPPEQVLQVMRSIADLLRQSEKKLEIEA